MSADIRQILREVRAGITEGAAAHDAERVREIGEQILGEIEERLSTSRPATRASDAPIYVVLSSAGGEGYSSGRNGEPKNDGGPIVTETEIGAASTVDAARARAAMLERRFGACRVARLVFEDVDGSPL